MILNADDDGTVWWLLVLLIKWCTRDMGVSGHFWLEKKVCQCRLLRLSQIKVIECQHDAHRIGIESFGA